METNRMDRTILHPKSARPPLLAILLLLATSGTAAALHDPLVAVSVAGAQVSVPGLLPALQHTAQPVAGTGGAPADAQPQASEEPAAPVQAAQPDAAPQAAWVAWAPWALAALALVAMALLAILLALALRAPRKAAPPQDADDRLRQELDLARMCSEAAVLRSTRLAARNAELRRELAALRDGGRATP
jgi:hypothetical protein